MLGIIYRRDGWTPAGSAFQVATNERDPKFFDLYRHDAKTYARTLVYQNDTGMNVPATGRRVHRDP